VSPDFNPFEPIFDTIKTPVRAAIAHYPDDLMAAPRTGLDAATARDAAGCYPLTSHAEWKPLRFKDSALNSDY
jgi:hypothetical protein